MKKKTEKRRNPLPKADPNRYPKGWTRARVQTLADYYDNQPDEEAVAELEAAFTDENTAMMQIPLELVPRVRKLIGKRAG